MTAKAGVLVGVVALMLCGCGGGSSTSSSAPRVATKSDVELCIDRGVAYFKEIGSYPTLKSKPSAGQRAEDVAKERCNRTTTAF